MDSLLRHRRTVDVSQATLRLPLIAVTTPIRRQAVLWVIVMELLTLLRTVLRLLAIALALPVALGPVTESLRPTWRSGRLRVSGSCGTAGCPGNRSAIRIGRRLP